MCLGVRELGCDRRNVVVNVVNNLCKRLSRNWLQFKKCVKSQESEGCTLGPM